VIDVIGDVHGQFDKLVGLLSYMGYRETGGAWRHPDRSVVFVGDLIDRGPKQLATVDLARRMVEAGSARGVMGNHEFNAIAWATPVPDIPGKFLRDHHKPGNREQHAAFLGEVEGTHLQKEITEWFKTLPLWLDLGGIRVVHACWHQPSIDLIRPLIGPGDTVTDELMLLGSRKEHWAYKAIETICKGPEVELPEGFSFKDKEGKVRTEVRVRWWQEDLSTYRKAAIGPAAEMEMIPDLPMPAEWVIEFKGLPQDVPTREAREASRSHASDSPPSSERMDARRARPDEEYPPVLFGHYWFSGKPDVISKRFACLDNSAARDGPLVAYRWDGEEELKTEKLAWV